MLLCAESCLEYGDSIYYMMVDNTETRTIQRISVELTQACPSTKETL